MRNLIHFIQNAKEAGVKNLTLTFWVAGLTFGRKNMNLRCSVSYTPLWHYVKGHSHKIEYKCNEELCRRLILSQSILESESIAIADEITVIAKMEVIIEIANLWSFASIKIIDNVSNSHFIQQFKDESESQLRKEIRQEINEEISYRYDMIFERERKLSDTIDAFEVIKKTQKNYAIRLKLIELENKINQKPMSSKRSNSVIDIDFEEQSNLLTEVNKIRKMINKL